MESGKKNSSENKAVLAQFVLIEEISHGLGW